MATGNHRFSIELPPGWEDRSIFTFWGPEENGLQHTINLTIEQFAGRSAKALAQSRCPALVGTAPEAEVLREADLQVPNAKSAYEVIFRQRSSENTPVLHREVYLVKDGMGFAFTGRFTKRSIKTQGKLLDQVIESFRLDGERGPVGARA